jgi:hypothetical protein
MLFHTLASENLDVVKYISTTVNPRTLQMLRCVSKVFRNGVDKEQCIASAIAHYTRAVLLSNGAYRLHSPYGYHQLDIFPLTKDSVIDGLQQHVFGYENSPAHFVFGELFNVLIDYNGRRYKGLIWGNFHSVPLEGGEYDEENGTGDEIDLGLGFFHSGTPLSLAPGTQRSWVVMSTTTTTTDDDEDYDDDEHYYYDNAYYFDLRVFVDLGDALGTFYSCVGMRDIVPMVSRGISSSSSSANSDVL